MSISPSLRPAAADFGPALRVGIVGCGKIADAHAEVLTFLPGATLVAVCDREVLLAEQLAKRFAVPRYYTDAAEMLAAEKLDVVHITTPPAAHLPLTKQCVEAGANVFLEKPLTLTAPESVELIRAVEAAGKRLAMNYWPNFEPQMMEFKQRLAAGEFGEPVHIEASIGYDLGGAYGQALMSDPNHWVHRMPGKLFQNIMDHMFNRIVPFFPDGDPEVQAFGFKYRTEIRNDSTDALLDQLRVVLRSGRLSAYATLASQAQPVGNTLKLYGTRATVEVDFNLRTVVTTGSQRYPSSLGRLFPPFQQAMQYLRQGRKNVRAFRQHRFHFFAGMTELLTQYYAAIRSGGPLPISYAEMLSTARIMDEVNAQVYPQNNTPNATDGGAA
ncbi:Gfo/Idh/MocA family protein [Bryocella elongata]|uniref:Gfo/Idh/MocA family protein n=1 Tax=Bryocella elongata TaxID=863522 RepID=UPI0013594D05|nr:Gfo/Idh/MocA family oxidoreductase [Bryocella elongata]